MKRNIVLPVVLTVLAAVMVLNCEKKERLYIYNWTYYTPDSVIEKFEDEYNVRVVYDEFASNEEMFAKIMATNREGIFGWLSKLFGRRYDIVFPSKDFVPIMIQEGLLERIDKTKLTNLGNIDPELMRKLNYDPDMEYSVPYFYGAAGIIVNTARVPDFEQSWSIFSRTDLKDRMIMLDDMREVIGGALVYLGYSVNTKDPTQIAEARDLVNNSWKPNLVKFDAEAFGLGFVNGEFWVVHGFPDAIYDEIGENPQLMKDTAFFIPQEGGPSYVDSMCILKRGENIDLAHKFIDFIHRPEIYAEFVDAFGLPATVNVPARELKEGFAWYSEDELANTELVDDIGPAIELYNNAWFNSIRIGK
ncbi:MAG: extracellular solute-binding protein [Treponema sp.]|jgi:spermidine/putrescine transport system substrate-binding protein|nr:extracellular solute-binding protein [Treponema sp.]